jgi:hypothetical protein
LSGGVQTVVANVGAFAAVKVDGSVVTWGFANFGGDSGSVAAQLSCDYSVEAAQLSPDACSCRSCRSRSGSISRLEELLYYTTCG